MAQPVYKALPASVFFNRCKRLWVAETCIQQSPQSRYTMMLKALFEAFVRGEIEYKRKTPHLTKRAKTAVGISLGWYDSWVKSKLGTKNGVWRSKYLTCTRIFIAILPTKGKTIFCFIFYVIWIFNYPWALVIHPSVRRLVTFAYGDVQLVDVRLVCFFFFHRTINFWPYLSRLRLGFVRLVHGYHMTAVLKGKGFDRHGTRLATLSHACSPFFPPSLRLFDKKGGLLFWCIFSYCIPISNLLFTWAGAVSFFLFF